MAEIGLGWGWGAGVQVRVGGLSASPGSQHGVVSHESHAPEKVRSSASAASNARRSPSVDGLSGACSGNSRSTASRIEALSE